MATWNTTFEATPAGSDNASTIDDKAREHKNETRVRADREHVWLNTTQATGGYHRAGSAKVYFTTATPANRPDGTVALDSDDKGRLWFRSSNGTLLVHNGTSFISTGVALSTAQTIGGAKTFSSIVSALGGISTGLTGKGLKYLLISMGSWNMDTTGDNYVTDSRISAGLIPKIVGLSAVIYADAYANAHPIDYGASGGGGTTRVLNDGRMHFFREANGLFDNISYNSTGFNRGWGVITYY